MTTTFMATARVSRNTLVESRTAMIRIKLTIVDPNIERSIRANIRLGMAIRTSTSRLSAWSNHPRSIAASKPSPPPIRKASTVVARAMPIVLRAP